MNYDNASTDIDAEERPTGEVKGAGPGATNGAVPPQPPPGTTKRNDFAASAAMVNDILAAGPSDRDDHADQANLVDRHGQAPEGPPPDAPGGEPEPAVSESAEEVTSPDFFARSKPKKPFWQMKATPRRARGGAHSEGRRRSLPNS
ncbi:MAG: hypothetical protein ACRDYE_07835 [Acidimicrobiales bacterium]